MATVTRESIGLLNEKIIVTVEKADYLPSFEKAIKTYSKQANIPGFRKGMVPVGMVKKMYGSSVFTDEVIKSVEKGLSEYMANEKLEIFAQPLPLQEDHSPRLDMNQPSEYAFAFEVGLKPEFTLPDLSQVQVTRYKVIVTDDMVDEEIKRLAMRLGKVTDREEVDSDDNSLDVTFLETDSDGKEVEGGIKHEATLPIKDFSLSVQEQLKGKKANEEIITRLSDAFDENKGASILGLPEDDNQRPDMTVKIVIRNISLFEKPEMNEDLFNKVFPSADIKTEEEFRNQIRVQVSKQWENDSRTQLSDQIYHELLNNTHIDFPEDFLKRWMVTSAEKPKTPEQVDKEFPTFVNQLKWTLIIDKIVHDNNVEVKSEDVIEFTKQQLAGYMGGANIDLDQPWVDTYIDKMMKDKKYVEDSYHRIQTDKAMLWAQSQVQPAETDIRADEFTKLLENHHH